MPQIDDYSAGYYLLDSELINHTGDSAVAPHDLMDEVARYTSVPLFRAGENHFYPKTERGIPHNTIAVPEHVETDTPVLLAKEQTALGVDMKEPL